MKFPGLVDIGPVAHSETVRFSTCPRYPVPKGREGLTMQQN